MTLTDGSQLVLEEPSVSGDTLSGLDLRGGGARRYGSPVHIPLVEEMERVGTSIGSLRKLNCLGLPEAARSTTYFNSGCQPYGPRMQ